MPRKAGKVCNPVSAMKRLSVWQGDIQLRCWIEHMVCKWELWVPSPVPHNPTTFQCGPQKKLKTATYDVLPCIPLLDLNDLISTPTVFHMLVAYLLDDKNGKVFAE